MKKTMNLNNCLVVIDVQPEYMNNINENMRKNNVVINDKLLFTSTTPS